MLSTQACRRFAASNHSRMPCVLCCRDDPNILAWDIANEPANPGDASGDVLFNWLGMLSAYVKSIDPNHLVRALLPLSAACSVRTLQGSCACCSRTGMGQLRSALLCCLAQCKRYGLCCWPKPVR